MGRGRTAAAAPSGQLDIRLFGQARLTAGDGPIKFAKRNRTIALLARIILQRGAPISRESVAYSIFPDEDEPTALAELRRYLYLAGKALPERPGDPWLIADAETVRWNVDAGAIIDVIAFEDLARSPQTQTQACDLYEGDLLDEIYDDWILTERERLRARYLTILDESLERFRSQRNFALASEYAKRILATDPWREDTLRSLMTVRYEAGDSAGALAEYERFAKHLRDELSIAPMPETVAVRQAILRGESLPGAAVRTVPQESRERRNSASILPFVGRARELASLRASWTRAARGTGTFVLIEGEAGIGKTRLTDELSRIVQAEGGRTFVGTTSVPESTPYQAIVEALRSAMPLLLASPPSAGSRATLARLLPELRDPAVPSVALPEQSIERELARLYDALADAVGRLASPRPMLIVLEDLHWSGSATIEALRAIVCELTRSSVLIVATCREEEVPPGHPLRMLVRSLRTLGNVSELQLSRFDEAEITDLVEKVERLRDRPPSFARELFVRSEGNALFVNELVSASLEGDGADDAAATSISNVIASRIVQLSQDALTVAQIAAVAGHGCGIELVRHVSNLPAVDVARGFDELLDRRILREAGSRASYDYVFTHHLITEAVYAQIEPDLRARRHSRIARLLETEPGRERNAFEREIARHHELAGEYAAAATSYVRAATAAARLYAYGDCIELATLALKLEAGIDVERAALEIRERAFGQRGERSSQRTDIDALERLAGDDARLRFEVFFRRVLLARTLGESDEEGRFIAQMLALESSLDDEARAKALVQYATHAGLRSLPAEGRAPALAALDIYREIGDVRGQLECLYLLVDFSANIGDIDVSQSHLAEMHRMANSLADKAVEARALAVAAQAALLRQEYRRSYDLSKKALAFQIATSDRDGEASSLGRLAVSAAWLGDFRGAMRDFDMALEAYASIGNKRGLALTHTNRTLLLMRVGLFEDALLSIERSNELFTSAHEQRTVVANAVNASFVRLQLGDAQAAKTLATTALALAREIAFPIFEAAALANLGNAERTLGSYEFAIKHMEAGIALRRPVQEARDFVDDLADLTLAYVGAGRDSDALATALELCSIDDGAFAGALWPHYVRWAAARGLAAGGSPERASEMESRARSELSAFAETIDEPRARAAFLAVPINAAIAMESL